MIDKRKWLNYILFLTENLKFRKSFKCDVILKAILQQYTPQTVTEQCEAQHMI